MDRYRTTRKQPLLDFVAKALEKSGARVVKGPDPSYAPFIFDVLSPTGERIELICYPFLANRYMQKGRPSDEHRLQVKYGSDFSRYHHLFIPKEPHRVTLMFGVHLEEEIFVAVDPEMHNPTWFSRSIEFKDHDIEGVHRHGWWGWERERSAGRRKRVAPNESFATEAVLGLAPRHFWRYVEVERATCGMDPALRLLQIDKLNPAHTKPSRLSVHPMEEELGLSAHEILDMISVRNRLKVAVRGGAAEEHLKTQLERVPGMDDVVMLDQDGQPDFEVCYRGSPRVRIECKNVLRRQNARAQSKVDFQKTRHSKEDPCSRYYRQTDFEVLAACLHPVLETWTFRFIATRDIATHERCVGRLNHRVVVDQDDRRWSERLPTVIERALEGVRG